MALTEKYTFDLDFDEERTRLQQERQAQHVEKKRMIEVQEREAAKERYTSEQIEEIKNQAREEGKRIGAEEARQSQESAMLDLLGQMMTKMQSFDVQESLREKLCQRTGIETAFALLQKISPALTKGKELDDVNAVIAQAFSENPDEQRLVIRVHDSILDTIIKNIDTVAAQNGFVGKPIVLSDQNLQPQDCRIEWADGGLERLSSSLWDGLEKAINHILVGLPEKTKKAEKEEAVSVNIKTEEVAKVKADATPEINDTTQKEEVSDE